MASFGKVLDLLDNRYLELQDVVGNVGSLPTLVPYDEYNHNVLVYRMDTNHEIFMGLIQDFTMRQAHETGKELWTWCVQWEVDNTPSEQQPSSPKKARYSIEHVATQSNAPQTPRQAPAITIFERRTLDGALMLEEEMLRILIDIVQVASSLVPNFIEFLYRWIDYYEGDGKALKAALRWEIPSLWDFEYHPLVLPENTKEEDEIAAGGQQEKGAQSTHQKRAAELRQSSPTKKMHARPKPDLAAIELQTFRTEESERLQYKEVKYGIQPPKLEQPLPPLINIPRDQRKRAKYYAACFKSRQRALYLLLEAGVTMRQINNYQKLQTAHPKQTPENGHENGLRNYQKDARFAQALFELKEKQVKQHEIAISHKLAVEAQFASHNAVNDGSAGLPLIPPTPSYTRRSDMAAAMMQRIQASRAKGPEKFNIVPRPLVSRMKNKLFGNSMEEPPIELTQETLIQRMMKELPLREETNRDGDGDEGEDDDDNDEEEDNDTDMEDDTDSDDESNEQDAVMSTVPAPTPNLPRPRLPLPLPLQPRIAMDSTVTSFGNPNALIPQRHNTVQTSVATSNSGGPNSVTPLSIATYMQNLSPEQAQRLLPLLNLEARQAVANRLGESPRNQSVIPQRTDVNDSSNLNYLELRPDVASTNQLMGNLSGLPSCLPAAQPMSNNGSALHSTQAGFRPFADPRIPSIAQHQYSGPTLAYQPSVADRSIPIPIAVQQYNTAQGTRNIPVYPLSPRNTGPTSLHAQPAGLSNLNTISSMELRSAQNQYASTADFTSQSAQIQSAQPSSPIPPLYPPTITPQHPVQQSFTSNGYTTLTPQFFPPTQFQQAQQTSSTSTITPPPHTSSSDMLPLPRPGIVRNAPTPLSLSPLRPSPFPTLLPDLLATSPFLNSPNTRTPIQIYLPRILIPGSRVGPSETQSCSSGSLETDALLLGHEEASTGKLVLSKAILLPVGVWSNTLRKVRSGRWSVLETYPSPFLNSTRKGKEKARESNCHVAAYEKLVQAYGLMTSDAKRREEELTKRWRVSRGPMTAVDRGAVWEGWGLYVDQEIAMSAVERKDALRSSAGGLFGNVEGLGGQLPVDDDADEVARRKKEMQELMDEDEDEDMEKQK
ncbi:hypothetical protein N0V94_006067 [Neodidymelliopsis sp. IMI 364377]|nr:hypothetical protein N0V94_006067 [Neodidymelliopsis sp. IMI 364377]